MSPLPDVNFLVTFDGRLRRSLAGTRLEPAVMLVE